MISRATNQKAARHLAYEAFLDLDLARNLDCVRVEPRNNLGRPLFDGISPSHAGAMARQRGLRLLGLSEVYPFNDWSEERANAIETLIAAAVESGAETISLIPRVNAGGAEDGVRQRRRIGSVTSSTFLPNRRPIARRSNSSS